MNTFVTSLCVFSCLVLANAEPPQAQPYREPQLPAVQMKPLIRVDRNFTGRYDDLVNKEVEVYGYTCLNDLGNGKVGGDAFVATGDRGGFDLTNWGPLWWKKNVRIIGTVTKGIDEREKVRKEFGNHPPAMIVRVQYLLTIKSIELLDAAEKQSPQTPQTSLAPQLPPQQPQRAPYLPKPLVRIDQNFKGAYGDLHDQDVEVCGFIRQTTAGENKAWIDPGDLGGLEIANLETKWFHRKVRIVGTIAKGIDPQEAEMKKNHKPGQPMILLAFRNFYVLTIKSIELEEADGPANSVYMPALPTPQR